MQEYLKRYWDYLKREVDFRSVISVVSHGEAWFPYSSLSHGML